MCNVLWIRSGFRYCSFGPIFGFVEAGSSGAGKLNFFLFRKITFISVEKWPGQKA